MSANPPTAPRTMAGPVPAARDAALAGREPVFVPATVHVDDRGWSIMNQLQGVLGPEGQVNYSLQFPGVVKAWHRHRNQIDFWICVRGLLKAGVHDQDRDRSWSLVIGEQHPGVLIVPAGLWHGLATMGVEPAGLVYFVTRAYDPAAPDEERRAADSVPGFSWEVANR